MSGNLIDTNIVIKLLSGDPRVSELFDTLDDVHLSVFTVGELMYVANKSSERESNLKLFNDFIGEYHILGVNAQASEVYAKIKHDMIRDGINIPENDIWIAAVAINSDMCLITGDNHFAGISELQSILVK
jgi:tRNA(fMet)-specific endonuclease VapC